MMFSLDQVLLTERLFIHDGATVNRPYDRPTAETATDYFETSVRGSNPVLFAEIEPFKEALVAPSNQGKINEVLARVRWSMDGHTALFIATNNLPSRLLAQDRARILKERLKQQTLELGIVWNETYQVPIYFYAPNEPYHRTLYDKAAQHRDIKKAKAIFENSDRRQAMEDNGDFEFLLFVPNLRSQYTDDEWRTLAKKLKHHKQPAIAWSLLEKNEALYQDPASEPLLRFAFDRAYQSKRPTPMMDMLHKKPELIESIYDFRNVLEILPDLQQRTVIFNQLQPQLPTMIKSCSCFGSALQYLTPDQRTVVFEAMRKTLPTIITSGIDFSRALQNFTPDQRTVVFEAMRETLPTIITSGINFGHALQYLTPDQRTVIYQTMLDTLPTIIKSGQDFGHALQYLTPDQRTVIYQAMLDTLPTIIKSGQDFGHALQNLTPDQCAVVCEAMKETLPTIIKSLDFMNALQNLTPDQRTVVFEAMRETLPTIIKSGDNFGWALKYLTPDQCAVVCKAMKETLPTIIKSGQDFGQALASLTPDQRTVIFQAMKDTLPTMMKSYSHLRCTLTYLTPSQCTFVCEAMKETLPTIIKSGRDFGRVIEALTPDQRDVIYEAMKDTLPTIIKSGRDFGRALHYLTPSQCTFVCEAIRDKFLEIIKEDVFSIILRLLPKDNRIAGLDGLGLTFVEAIKTCSSKHREAIWEQVPSERKHRLASLLPLTDTYSTLPLAIALMDNNQDQIKSQMRRLCQTKADSPGYFRKRSIDFLIDKLSRLDECWIRRINTALDLHLSEEACAQSQSVKTALLSYAKPQPIPTTLQFTREGLITALTQYVEKFKMLQKAQSDSTFAHFNVGLFKTRQHENRTANVWYALEKLEQLKTQSVHDVFPNREQALKNRKRLMAGRSFHDHGIRSHDLNDILHYADSFIKTNPEAANNSPGDMNEAAQHISPS